MRNRISLCAGVLLVAGLLAAPDPATAQDETITLKFHSSFGQSPQNMGPRWWMDEVEKRTNGKVKFDRIFGGPLGKLAAAPENVKVGAFDLGNISVVYNPGLYPLGTVTTLPFMGDDQLVHGKAAHELFASGPVNEEFTTLNQKYLGPGMWSAIELMSYEPARTMEDLKQMKIRAHGGGADILKELGMTPYGIPWGELPAAAERKVVDAMLGGAPNDAAAFGFGNIFEYWNQDEVWYWFPLTFVMNLDTWNKLPDDVKKVMDEVSAELVMEKGQKPFLELENESTQTLLDQGVKAVRFEELDEVKAAREKVWQNWVDARAEEGKPGKEVLDNFLELVEKHQ